MDIVIKGAIKFPFLFIYKLILTQACFCFTIFHHLKFHPCHFLNADWLPLVNVNSEKNKAEIPNFPCRINPKQSKLSIHSKLVFHK